MAHLALDDRITWGHFPNTYNRITEYMHRSEWRAEAATGFASQWGGVKFVTYYAWTGSIMRSVLHVQRMCSVERVLLTGNPSGVPYCDELETDTGLDRCGEWHTNLDDPEVVATAE